MVPGGEKEGYPPWYRCRHGGHTTRAYTPPYTTLGIPAHPTVHSCPVPAGSAGRGVAVRRRGLKKDVNYGNMDHFSLYSPKV